MHRSARTIHEAFGVPATLDGNACLLSTEKARAVLGYRPRPYGTYVPAELVW